MNEEARTDEKHKAEGQKGALAFSVLGEIRVQNGERHLGPRELGGIKSKQILEILLLNRGHAVSKDSLADLLWGEQLPTDYFGALESHVSVLRSRLQPGTKVRESVIRTEPGGYRFVPGDATIDLDHFDALVAEADRARPPKSRELLTAALDLAARHDRRLLVERAVQGREVEVAVLGNDAPEASVPGEVCYAGEWYDYETKYGQGHTTFKVPAPLAPEVTARVRELAIRAFQAIDGAGLARVDFFIENDSHVLVNEINTLPGFTATSAYPKLWEASGISYTELISRLIDLARERR